MAHRDDHGVVGIEVFGVEFVLVGDDFRATGVAILLFHFLQLLLHHLLAALGVVEDFLQVLDELHQLVVFLMELIHAQARELREAHIHDGLRLQLVELETSLQIALGIGRRLTVSNNVDNLVDVVHGDNQSFENVGTLLRLLQVVLRATDGHVVTMLHEIFHAFLQREQARTALYERNVIH